MAPHHHEIGTDSTIRWNNSGTVTVEGSEDEGFDYSYTPDTSKKSWRLQRSLPGGTASSGGNGVTGGDWSKDGIRRYHTGGSIETTTRGGGRVGGGGGVSSTNIMNLGSFDVDVGVMDGVAVSPKKKQGKKVETVVKNKGKKIGGNEFIDFPSKEIQGITRNLLHKKIL